jgi:uncharacterized protein YodC (DUF2158 family)
MNEIKIGTIVRLKSGGPLMTVVKLGSQVQGHEHYVFCEWFMGDKVEHRTFDPGSLDIVEQKS